MMHRTRSVAKKEREMENICRPHRYQFVLNPEKTPITDRVTRSVTKALNIIGIELPKPQLPQKVIRRRATHAPRIPTPKTKVIANRRSLQNAGNASTQTSGDHVWCICSRPSFGHMILCDNPNCRIRWFHMYCMNITSAPAGSWYCKNCSILFDRHNKQM